MRLKDKIKRPDRKSPVVAEVLAEKPAAEPATVHGQQDKAAKPQRPYAERTDVTLECSVDSLSVIRLPAHYVILSDHLDGTAAVSVEHIDKKIPDPASWKDNPISENQERLFDLGERSGDLRVVCKGKRDGKLFVTLSISGVETSLLQESRMLSYWEHMMGTDYSPHGADLLSVVEGRGARRPGPHETDKMWVGFSRIGSSEVSRSALAEGFAERGIELVNSLSLGSEAAKSGAPAEIPGAESVMSSIDDLLGELKGKLLSLKTLAKSSEKHGTA
jgi:hypothetical protein